MPTTPELADPLTPVLTTLTINATIVTWAGYYVHSDGGVAYSDAVDLRAVHALRWTSVAGDAGRGRIGIFTRRRKLIVACAHHADYKAMAALWRQVRGGGAL